MGVEAMVESVEMVRNNAAPKIVQDESQATYEGWCRADDAVIDWSRPVSEVYNLIRGADPSPGAGTTFDGKKIQLFRASKADGDTGKAPGEVVEVTDDGFRIAAAAGSILVGRVQAEGARKVMSPEWVGSVGLRPGARFVE